MAAISGSEIESTPSTATESTADSRRWLRIPFWSLFCVSLAFSAAFLKTRNINEDERWSFQAIRLPYVGIWQFANSRDAHPPGMYIAGRFFYELTGSARWMTIGPLLMFYAGLGFFVFRFARLFRDDVFASWLFCGLAFLNPELLLWCNSYRWYPYWTALALAVLALAFGASTERPQQGAASIPGILPACAVGVLMGAMFYVNYLTLPFLAAFSIAWMVRYGCTRTSLAGLAVPLLIAGVAAIPQIAPFLSVHIHATGYQTSSVAGSALRFVQGIFFSEAFWPVHPAVAVVAIGVLAPVALSAFRWLPNAIRMARCNHSASAGARMALALWTFFMALSGLGVAMGLTQKPRSFLLICPVWGFVAACCVSVVRARWARVMMLIAATAWIGMGMWNLLNKTGTALGYTIDRTDEMATTIEQIAGSKPALIVLHDDGLMSELNNRKRAANRKWSFCCAIPDFINGRPGVDVDDLRDVSLLIVVRTHVFGSRRIRKVQLIEQGLDEASRDIADPVVSRFHPDARARLSKWVPRDIAATMNDIPEFRYEVAYGTPRSDADLQHVVRIFAEAERAPYR